MRFYEEVNGIFRLKIPFENIYTSVFLIRETDGWMMIDCGNDETDVENVLLPALEERSVPLGLIKCLLLTHLHGDHAGGAMAIVKKNPVLNAYLPKSNERFGRLRSVALCGHTDDCVGYFDSTTKTHGRTNIR